MHHALHWKGVLEKHRSWLSMRKELKAEDHQAASVLKSGMEVRNSGNCAEMLQLAHEMTQLLLAAETLIARLKDP
jgi:hypothetical protein